MFTETMIAKQIYQSLTNISLSGIYPHPLQLTKQNVTNRKPVPY